MLVVQVPIFVISFLMAGFAQGFMQSIKKSKNQKIRRRKGFMLVFFPFTITPLYTTGPC